MKLLPSDILDTFMEHLRLETQEQADARTVQSVSKVSDFTVTDVDAIFYVALLSALQELTAIPSTHTGLVPPFPTSSSSFYSSHILPHRPAHWPPRPVKGKRAKQAKGKGLPGLFKGEFDSLLHQSDRDVGSGELVADAVVVAKSSSKKFTKWIKSVNRGGQGGELLRLKEGKGEVTIIGFDSNHMQ